MKIHRIMKFGTPIFKTYYLKMMVFYSAFTLIVIISSSSILSGYLSKSLENEIYRTNIGLLSQMQIFCDTYLVSKVSSIVAENASVASNSKVSNFLNNKMQDGFYNQFEVLQDMKEYVTKNSDFIDSIYTYRKYDDIFISTGEGIFYSALHPKAAPDNVVTSKDAVQSLIHVELLQRGMGEENSSPFWVSPLENRSHWRDTPVISFVQPFKVSMASSDKTGCFIININVQNFFKSVSKIQDSSIGNFMVIDSLGRVLIHRDPSKLYQTVDSADYFLTVSSSDSGFSSYMLDHKPVGISWTKSAINDWKYISIIPLETLNKKALVAKQFSVLIIAVVTFISLIGLYLITSVLYRPLKKLVQAAKETFNVKGGSDNEIVLLDNVIAGLSYRVEEVEKSLHENRGLIEYRLAVDILHGSVKSPEDLRNRLQIINKEFPFAQSCILIIQMNAQIINILPMDQQEYISYKIIKLANSSLSQNGICISAYLPPNNVAAVINFDSYADILANADTLIAQIEKEFGQTCNIALGTPEENANQLYKQFSRVMDFFKYAYVYGYGNVFSYSDVDRFETCNGDFSPDIQKNLEALLKSCKVELFKEEVKGIIDSIKRECCSYQYVQSVVMQIINLVCRVSKEQEAVTEELDKNKVVSGFNKTSSLDETLNWIFQIADIYAESIGRRNSSMDTEFVNKIKSHINDNIANQISLNSVAEEFNISTRHLSRIFKEETGYNFSDYVIEKKFEKAKELLILERHLEVSEVAEKLGYWNLPYFTKLFKEKYGMTPVQYRKRNISS